MRIIFFGTPDFAVPTLKRLIDSPHEIAAVFTQPDKPKGRGLKLTPPPVKVLAEEIGIPVHQPKGLKNDAAAELIEGLKADVAVVVAYGKILPKRILDAPKHGCLNIHASLLPKYRGAAPIQWAIVRGERKTGVTIMQMDEGMDTGPMIRSSEVEILEDDDSVSLANMLSMMGAQLIIEVLDDLEKNGTLESTPQNDDEATRAPLIKREDARIDWTSGYEEIICLIHGFLPWPKAFTTIKDKELKITGAEACDPGWVPPTAFDDRLPPGAVVDILKGRGFVVKTTDKSALVLVTRVQPPGKPEMGAYDFANGGGIEVGQVLGT